MKFPLNTILGICSSWVLCTSLPLVAQEISADSVNNEVQNRPQAMMMEGDEGGVAQAADALVAKLVPGNSSSSAVNVSDAVSSSSVTLATQERSSSHDLTLSTASLQSTGSSSKSGATDGAVSSSSQVSPLPALEATFYLSAEECKERANKADEQYQHYKNVDNFNGDVTAAMEEWYPKIAGNALFEKSAWNNAAKLFGKNHKEYEENIALANLHHGENEGYLKTLEEKKSRLLEDINNEINSNVSSGQSDTHISNQTGLLLQDQRKAALEEAKTKAVKAEIDEIIPPSSQLNAYVKEVWDLGCSWNDAKADPKRHATAALLLSINASLFAKSITYISDFEKERKEMSEKINEDYNNVCNLFKQLYLVDDNMQEDAEVAAINGHVKLNNNELADACYVFAKACFYREKALSELSDLSDSYDSCSRVNECLSFRSNESGKEIQTRVNNLALLARNYEISGSLFKEGKKDEGTAYASLAYYQKRSTELFPKLSITSSVFKNPSLASAISLQEKIIGLLKNSRQASEGTKKCAYELVKCLHAKAELYSEEAITESQDVNKKSHKDMDKQIKNAEKDLKEAQGKNSYWNSCWSFCY